MCPSPYETMSYESAKMACANKTGTFDSRSCECVTQVDRTCPDGTLLTDAASKCKESQGQFDAATCFCMEAEKCPDGQTLVQSAADRCREDQGVFNRVHKRHPKRYTRPILN